MKKLNKWWIIAISWCLVIAMATRRPGLTGESTESFFDFIVFIDPEIMNYFFRKGVHLASFGLLAIFFFLALDRIRRRKIRYYGAWILASGYGVIDEVHQSFLPDRTASVLDVLINSLGACLALMIIHLCYISKLEKERRMLRSRQLEM
ncbi:VanZ family protein [Halalkalibacter sp. APA_J-10(15)]|uniref:VanZ family protein n=1 Tax=unclassified Halalkalibacter TaxID=2893063 RepID=UPI001FF691EA|nr:VanZ family protein [Halalkalibacter sp. APA_J-10(15)]MCK0470072.1 VanZ family protein [Halalkalibacter sp. APA_J-10(15)]